MGKAARKANRGKAVRHDPLHGGNKKKSSNGGGEVGDLHALVTEVSLSFKVHKTTVPYLQVNTHLISQCIYSSPFLCGLNDDADG